MEEGLRGPGHEGDGLFAGEVRDVDLPGEGFDADGAADGKGELVDLLAGELTVERSQGFADPGDRAALPQWQRRSRVVVCVQ